MLSCYSTHGAATYKDIRAHLSGYTKGDIDAAVDVICITIRNPPIYLRRYTTLIIFILCVLRLYACVYLRIYVCMYVCMYVCVCVCVCV